MTQEIYPPNYGMYKEPSAWAPVHKDATITVEKPSAIVVSIIFLVLTVVCVLAGIIIYFVSCNGFFDYIVHLFTVLLPWLISGIICFGLCVFLDSRQHVQAWKVMKNYPLTFASARQVYGITGNLSTAFFGNTVDKGKLGEATTASILQTILKMFPEARLLNGVKNPATESSDIDHVLLVRDFLFVIDSKCWDVHSVAWGGHEEVIIDGGTQEPREISIQLQAQNIRALFPDRQVIGIVVFHRPDGALVRVENSSWMLGGCVALNARDLIPVILGQINSYPVREGMLEVSALSFFFKLLQGPIEGRPVEDQKTILARESSLAQNPVELDIAYSNGEIDGDTYWRLKGHSG